MFAAEMQHYPTVLQRKNIHSMPGTLSPELLELVGSRITFFFLAQIIFFSPSRVAFGVLM